MKKSILTLISIMMTSIIIGGCTKGKSEDKASSDKINVTVSIEPLKEFAEIVGGDKVNVTTMVPTGSEPHDFEPKTRDLVELNESEIFVYNGLDMEAWIDQVIETIQNNDMVIINSSEGANVLEHEENESNKHVEDKHDDEKNAHSHGTIDPHLWLSLKESKVQANNIKNALVKVDEVNKDYYEENYNSFVKEVDDLYNEYLPKFEELNNKNFVTGHAAFGYLCRDFGLHEESVENIFGEGEITPQRLKELVEFCKENNVKTIFMPELASEKIASTLANEVDAKVEKIYSLESKAESLTYIEAMKDNLEKIYINLKQ